MNKKNRFITLFSFLFVSVLLIGAFGFLFRVKKISCQIINQSQQKANELCSKLVTLNNKSLFFFDFENDGLVQEALFNEETQEAFFVKEISKSLPGGVNYVFTTKPPLYRLVYGDEKWLITMEGNLIKDDERISVIEVILADKSLLFDEGGEFYSHREKFIRQLLEPLQQQPDLEIENMVVDSLERVVLNIKNLPSVILDFSQNGVEQSKRLEIILQDLDQFKDGEKQLDIREIDLRFELPVLRTYRETEILLDSPEENLL